MSVFTLDEGTKLEVAAALEKLLARRDRCRIWYGDTKTGQAWQEENDVLGYIGRSTGQHKVALLVANSRSTGGGAILTACIVRIDSTAGQILYSHPTFSSGFDQGRVSDSSPYPDRPWTVMDSWGKSCANFKTEKQARNWLAFMKGERYAK